MWRLVLLAGTTPISALHSVSNPSFQSFAKSVGSVSPGRRARGVGFINATVKVLPPGASLESVSPLFVAEQHQLGNIYGRCLEADDQKRLPVIGGCDTQKFLVYHKNSVESIAEKLKMPGSFPDRLFNTILLAEVPPKVLADPGVAAGLFRIMGLCGKLVLTSPVRVPDGWSITFRSEQEETISALKEAGFADLQKDTRVMRPGERTGGNTNVRRDASEGGASQMLAAVLQRPCDTGDGSEEAALAAQEAEEAAIKAMSRRFGKAAVAKRMEEQRKAEEAAAKKEAAEKEKARRIAAMEAAMKTGAEKSGQVRKAVVVQKYLEENTMEAGAVWGKADRMAAAQEAGKAAAAQRASQKAAQIKEVAVSRAATESATSVYQDLSYRGDPVDIAYITFIEGDINALLGFVMAKSMHELGHKYPNIFMVRDDSPLAKNAQAMNQVMQKHGWKASVQVFRPYRFGNVSVQALPRAADRWMEAYQRINLLRIAPAQLKKFVHLDADIMVMRNVDELAEQSQENTFAHRMMDCKTWDRLESDQPITNFYVGMPNLQMFTKIDEFMKRSQGAKVPDEAKLISRLDDEMGKNKSLISPEDLFYWECFMNLASDEGMRNYRPSLPSGIKTVHLGNYGRRPVLNAMTSRNPEPEAIALERGGHHFAGDIVRKWYKYATSPDVEDLILAAGAFMS